MRDSHEMDERLWEDVEYPKAKTRYGPGAKGGEDFFHS